MKKALSILLIVVMMLTCMPAFAFAEGSGADASQEPTEAEVLAAKKAYEDAVKAVDDAQKEYTQKTAAVAKATSELTQANADLAMAGHDFINQKAGGTLTYESLSQYFKKNSAISPYMASDYDELLKSAYSLENINKAVEYIEECNSLRAGHSLSALKINYRLMVLSAVSAAVCANDDAPSHVVVNELYRLYKQSEIASPATLIVPLPSENLAWGYSDPFDGWYTEEKAEYDKGATTGVGHYLNIVANDLATTGYATLKYTGYFKTDEQAFGKTQYATGYGESVTPAAFKTALDSFAKDKQDAVQTATTNLQTAKTEYQAAVAKLNQAMSDAAKAKNDYESLAKFPAPVSPKWRDDNFPTMAVWEAAPSEHVSKYVVQAKVVKAGGAEVLSDPVDVEGTNDGYDFVDFFKENGSGEYSFTVKAVPEAGSPWLESDEAASDAGSYKALKARVKVLDEEGAELEDDNSQGKIDIYKGSFDEDDFVEGGTISAFKYIVIPEGRKIEIGSNTDMGYMFQKISFAGGNEPADVKYDGKTARFTLDKDYEVIVTIKQDLRKVPVVIDFGDGHKELAGKILAEIQNDDEHSEGSSVDGSKLTIEWLLASTQADLRSYVEDLLNDYFDMEPGFAENNETFYGEIGLKRMTEYADYDEQAHERVAAAKKDMEEDLVFYVLWLKKAETGAFTIDAPLCGKEVKISEGEAGITDVQSYRPVVKSAEGSEMIMDNSLFDEPWMYWYKELNISLMRKGSAGWFEGTIEGGSEYNAGFVASAKIGYYFDENDIPAITVDGNAVDAENVVLSDRFTAFVMAKVTAAHDLTHVGEVPATCEEAGCGEYYKCAGCNKIFKDKAGTQETTLEALAIKATGHDWEFDPDKINDDTHTKVCKNDPSHVITEKHKFEFVNSDEATCSYPGEDVYRCECGKYKYVETTPALGHDFGTWTPFSDTQHVRTCKRNDEHKEYEAHKWDSGVVTKDATETKEGEIKYTCQDCGAERTEAIPIITHDHVLVKTEARAATCEEDGNIDYWTCKECKRIYSDSEAKKQITIGDTVIKAYGHSLTHYDMKAPTCEEDGNKEYWACDGGDHPCGKYFADAKASSEIKPADVIIPKLGHDFSAWTPVDAEQHRRICANDNSHIETAPHTWDSGVVTKEATETEQGEKLFTCTACGATKTEAVEWIPPEDRMGEDGTPIGKGASFEAADKAITSLKSDNDPAGSKVAPLFVRSTKQTKNSIKLTWKKPAGAKTFVLYGNKCGKKNKMKKIKTLTKTSITVKKAVKKLAKGKYYKFIVVSLDADNNVVSTSKIVHACTKGGKVGNFKSVKTKAKKNKVTLKVGKTFKLSGKGVPASKKLKVKKHVGIRYESANTDIATVSKKSIIKAKKKGSCYVYAYSQNGTYAKIKVTVK